MGLIPNYDLMETKTEANKSLKFLDINANCIYKKFIKSIQRKLKVA